MAATARGTDASASKVARSRCAPPSATSRSMIDGKTGCSWMTAAMAAITPSTFAAGAGEHLAQQRAVQLLFAREVVVEHRLVHAGAAGDAVDAGAGVAAFGELERGGM